MLVKTVFVSSTYWDLKEHRRRVWEVLEDFEVSVRGMEQFGARTEEPLQTCINEVEQSDVYVGVIGHRLGSVHEEKGLSYTQLEYERAYELDLDILIYLIDEEAEIKAKYIDRGNQRDKLESFKRTLKERHTIDTFTSPPDLGEKIRRDFKRTLGSPQNVVAGEFDREIKQSREAIEKFLLVPKEVSGREILLNLEFKGDLFPASRDICRAFNLRFGATVGISIDIVEPDGFQGSDLSYLFIDAKNLDAVWLENKGDRKHVYAKLQFTEGEVDNVKTRFKSETRTYIKSNFLGDDVLSALSGKNFHEETVRLQAEGNVILLFTKSAEYKDSSESETTGST